MALYKKPVVSGNGMWEEVKQNIIRPRLIVSIRGEEREGKTQLALTAPPPIAVFPFDNNTLEIVRKWMMMKKILVPPESLDYKDATDQAEYERIWELYRSYYLDAIASPSIRSIVVDTATETWELIRLARLGKLTQVMPIQYTKVNSEYQDLIKRVYNTDKNLILVHRLKDQYQKGGAKGEGVRTGVRIINGYADVGYKVQMNLISWRDLDRRDEEKGTQGFGVTICDSTQAEYLAGTFLEEPENTLSEIGTRVYMDSKIDDWV